VNSLRTTTSLGLELPPATNLIDALSADQTPVFTLASEFSPSSSLANTQHTPQMILWHILRAWKRLAYYCMGGTLAMLDLSSAGLLLGVGALLARLGAGEGPFSAKSFASDADSDAGADTVFDAAERSGEGLWAGSAMGIVTGFQTRDNDARIMWVGGVELFSDTYARKLLPSYVSSSPFSRVARSKRDFLSL
jgi:oligosaccharyltransferase complex subunit beta